MPERQNDLLFAMLRQTQLFNDVQLDQLMAEDRQGDIGITETVVRLGLAGEEEFLQAAARVIGIDYLDVSDLEAQPEIIEKLPARAVYQYNVIPVAFDDGMLTIATSDPFNIIQLDGLRIASGWPIRAVACTAEKIARQARKYYGVGGDTFEKMMSGGRYDLEAEAESLKYDLSDVGQEASIVRFVNQIIAEADKQGATDIHVEPMEHELRIRYRVDGLLHKVDVPAQLHRVQAAVISRIKVMANLDIAEKRMPMDGRIGIRVNNKDVDIRVSTCPTVYGESISLRLLQKGGGLVRLSQLGLSPRDEKIITKTIHRPNGIVLVTGPTGSGKSTSLYAFLHEINTVEKRILTAEEPVEYEMPGINQVLVRPDIGLTFARVLRSFLRQDPDVLMVGEIRDLETAEIAINASLTGHLVFSTLHTNDAAGAFARLIDMGVEPFLVASSVVNVLAQRLLRKLCATCRAETTADPALLERMDIDPALFTDRRIHASQGCQRCGQTGFKGRGGIFEVLNVTERLRTLVTEHRPTAVIRDAAIAEGMTTLRDDGWTKVFSGLTTIEEVLRVTEDQGD